MNRIHEELFEAAKENNLPEVRRLLSVGADVNNKYGGYGAGETPLHRASSYGHVQVFKELVKHGADIEAKTKFGWTPLHWACLNGGLAVVIELVSPGDEIHANDSSGATTSILGKRKSRRGANIEAKDNKGNTPLHLASMEDCVPVVKALLSGGANILAANDAGLLPIDQAVRRRRLAVIKYLIQQLYATTRRLPLHELVEDLTWIGDPNISDGVPPLRKAFDGYLLYTNDVVDILEYLVDRDPTLLRSRDPDGSLPLHLACRRGASFTIIQSLMNLYQASVKSVTPQGDLPLFLACEIPEPSLDTIFLLMKLYPDIVYR
jgi:ankyrin repeat protein